MLSSLPVSSKQLEGITRTSTEHQSPVTGSRQATWLELNRAAWWLRPLKWLLLMVTSTVMSCKGGRKLSLPSAGDEEEDEDEEVSKVVSHAPVGMCIFKVRGPTDS